MTARNQLIARVERIRALFVVHYWSASRTCRDGKSHFTCDEMDAVVAPRDMTVTFTNEALEQYCYSIQDDAATIERIIVAKDCSVAAPRTLPIIAVNGITAQATLMSNRLMKLSIHDDMNHTPITLNLAQLVQFRDQLTGIINIMRGKKAL